VFVLLLLLIFFSREGLQPRPFYPIWTCDGLFFSSDHGLRAFAIFRVIVSDLHAIFKVERSGS
jgi:hypothetical protein